MDEGVIGRARGTERRGGQSRELGMSGGTESVADVGGRL